MRTMEEDIVSSKRLYMSGLPGAAGTLELLYHACEISMQYLGKIHKPTPTRERPFQCSAAYIYTVGMSKAFLFLQSP